MGKSDNAFYGHGRRETGTFMCCWHCKMDYLAVSEQKYVVLFIVLYTLKCQFLEFPKYIPNKIKIHLHKVILCFIIPNYETLEPHFVCHLSNAEVLVVTLWTTPCHPRKERRQKKSEQIRGQVQKRSSAKAKFGTSSVNYFCLTKPHDKTLKEVPNYKAFKSFSVVI